MTSQSKREGGEGAPVRVLVVDDFEPFRRQTSRTVREEAGFEVVGESPDGPDAVCKARELKPDVVILDIGLPSLNGLEVAREIRVVAPDSKIVFLTANGYPQVVREALNAGAVGYVLKLDGLTELLRAIEAVLLGKRYLSKSLIERGVDL